MKQIFTFIFFSVLCTSAIAQSWLTTGNSGTNATTNFLGTTDNNSLVFKTNNIVRGRILNTGAWRLGTTTDYSQVDATGHLTFAGAGAYYVGGNKYVFQYAATPNYGLFFNSTSPQYEFRNSSAVPVFYINADNGNGVFNGNLKIGTYTLPSTDGTNGQVLTTNGSGSVKVDASTLAAGAY